MVSEVHQDDHSYVLELSGPTFRFTMQEFSMVGGYTEDLRKPQNCQNLEGWALARGNMVSIENSTFL